MSSISNETYEYSFFTDLSRISRGVCQGDPVFPNIYILYFNDWTQYFNQNNHNLKRIKINNTEYLITQFADGTALTLAADLNSLNVVFENIDSFAQYSGLKANFLSNTNDLDLGKRVSAEQL